jgi:hypothetical protein
MTQGCMPDKLIFSLFPVTMWSPECEELCPGRGTTGDSFSPASHLGEEDLAYVSVWI